MRKEIKWTPVVLKAECGQIYAITSSQFWFSILTARPGGIGTLRTKGPKNCLAGSNRGSFVVQHSVSNSIHPDVSGSSQANN